MERRSFLKLCVASTAVAGLPSFVFADITDISNDDNWVGMVRETRYFDIYNDAERYRYDLLTDNVQHSVDCMVESGGDIEPMKKQALKLLREVMIEDGIKISDLKRLPMPYESMKAVA